MEPFLQILIFQLDEQKFAISLSSVKRILRAVEVTPVPKAPLIIHGVIDLGGEIIPVINLRRRLAYPEQPVHPDNRFILARNSRRTIVLVADEVQGIEHAREGDFIKADHIVKGMEIEGVVKRKDGVILIYDIDKFLPIEEEKILNEALNKQKQGK